LPHDGERIPLWARGLCRKQATETELTNAKTKNETKEASTQIFKETVAGAPLELQATGVAGTGSLVNKVDENKEHYTEGTALLEYTGVTVVSPAGKGCKVFTDNNKVKGADGKIDAHLEFTTTKQEDSVKFGPVGATGEKAPLATFFIEGCFPAVPAIEGTWEIIGSLTCKSNGATINCSHAEITTANTLKGKKGGFEGKAGFEGSFTVSGRANSGEAFTPLSMTTVGT
jgi:hypothetical protein